LKPHKPVVLWDTFIGKISPVARRKLAAPFIQLGHSVFAAKDQHFCIATNAAAFHPVPNEIWAMFKKN
jgi:hypothetical protein